MKKNFKKAMSLVLVLVMMLSVSSVAFAKEEKPTPVIVVSGMTAFPLFDENGKSVFPMSNEKIVRDVFGMITPLAVSLAKNDWSVFAKYGTAPIHDLFEEIRCDENGNSVYNVHAQSFTESAGNYPETFADATVTEVGVIKDIAEKIGWDNTYYYHYDWRMNPLDLADDLDKTVQKVLSETGSDKVSFFAMSFGGMIATSYMYKYGTEHLKNVVYGSTAFCGVEMVGRLFSGDMSINISDTLVYLEAFARNAGFVSNFIGIANSTLDKYAQSTKKAVDEYLSQIIEVLKYPAYTEVFMDTFAHFEGMWCLMPNSYYENAKAFMSETSVISDSFYSDVEEYLFNVQAKNEEIIYAAKEDGVNVSIIGAYGYAGIPLADSTKQRTDTLIDTYLMTGNCAVAPMGKTVADMDYSKDGACTEHNHLSTDGIIDASVGMLPENTWVIKNMGHVEYDNRTQAGKLATWVVTSEEPVDVHSDARYPQFVELDRRSGAFISLTEGVTIPESEENSVSRLTLFVNFLEKLLSYILKIFGMEMVK